jgi:hypothetical protein
VFQNPSLTNWIFAKSSSEKPAEKAFVGVTSSKGDLEKFTDAEIATQLLTESGIEVINPAPSSVDLESIGTKDVHWLVLHLASHGIFEMPRAEMGLLLSRDGHLPPPIDNGVDDNFRKYLAGPNDLRDAGATGRLVFLASCLSSRNQEYPGDDLMGVTRALFAGGTVDMIAGAWTVVSEVTEVFVQHFYRALLSGQTMAQAVFEARKSVATTYPDSFHWGVFVHQGANLTLSSNMTLVNRRQKVSYPLIFANLR